MTDKRDKTSVKEKLGAKLNGRVLTPDDAGFDNARALFYGWNNRRPAAIIKAANETDVSRVVSFARENELELAIRSGGHSLAGHSMSEGGIVLDLSDMKKIEIDKTKQTAWAETGLTAGQFTKEAGTHGLAVGFGDTATVGIGGITLGGGVGFFVRKYGLTIDDLLAADIVTADGKLLRTDAENHPDLFWAIRGGGGNFGVATRFMFRLHEVPSIVGGIMMQPANAEIIRSFIAEAEAAPEELSVLANVMPAPPMPFVPKEYHGQLIIMAMMVYAGETEAGQRVIAPLKALAKPIMDMVRPMKYHEMFEGPEGPHPVAAAVHNMFIDTVDQRTSETIVDHLKASTASMSVTQLRILGGAMARVSNEATAFAHRKRKIMVNVAALYEKHEDAPVHNAWVSGLAKALRQGEGGVYVNFLGDEGAARVREAYPGSSWGRLVSIKKRYDPTNFFRMNHNIQPAD
ncbi:MAG: FAD-binding oxidoreductase [Ignavibacteriales bacterium]|nr:FAD-binding oxidoreductase [Ignavibacteriales bacterium]